jgi:hypothetical protein
MSLILSEFNSEKEFFIVLNMPFVLLTILIHAEVDKLE